MKNLEKNNPVIISHSKSSSSELNLELYRNQLKNSLNLTYSLEDSLKLLEELAEFEFGRFLLSNKGINGYWTSYMISPPKDKEFSPLESWLLFECPILKATRERFSIFKNQTQKFLKNGAKFASIPCGVMDDLLELDYSEFSGVELVGIDLDEESLVLAEKNTKEKNFSGASFLKCDAWNLDSPEEFDLITCNGLNIYEKSDERALELYREFYRALKPNGILVTSFMTAPPTIDANSPWKDFILEDIYKQKVLLSEIIQIDNLTFRSEETMRSHMKESGLSIREIIYDAQGMFPTVIAQKHA